MKTTDKYLQEMAGWLELGMGDECLKIASRLLQHKNICARSFQACIDSILIQAHRLPRWRRRVESAYENLPPNAQTAASANLFHFYVSLEHWNGAARLLPADPRSPIDLLFSMWTLLEQKRADEAKTLFLRCKRTLVRAGSDFELSCLIEAIASYCAQTGDWIKAESMWAIGAEFQPFAPQAWEGLLKIHAYRGLLQANEAFDAIRCCEFWDSGIDITLPRNNARLRIQLDAQFHRLARHLAKVILPKERWKFGG